MSEFMYIVLILISFFLLRVTYVQIVQLKAIDAVRNYNVWQIENNYANYGRTRINYFTVCISFEEHLFSFWRWGKYSALKGEYVERLKPFYKKPK